MSDYHEPTDELSNEARDFHRALTSLKEEIEAVDWYHQRVERCHDADLKAVLAHNRDEEIEHACMTLEWLRRKMPAWDSQLRAYLFKSEPIIAMEHSEHGAPHEQPSDLGIGSLKKKEQE